MDGSVEAKRGRGDGTRGFPKFDSPSYVVGFGVVDGAPFGVGFGVVFDVLPALVWALLVRLDYPRRQGVLHVVAGETFFCSGCRSDGGVLPSQFLICAPAILVGILVSPALHRAASSKRKKERMTRGAGPSSLPASSDPRTRKTMIRLRRSPNQSHRPP